MMIAMNIDGEQQGEVNKKIIRWDWRRYDEQNIRILFDKDQDVASLLVEAETIDDIDLLNEKITEVYKYILYKLAPPRVFIMRRDNHIVNSEIEAVKKRIQNCTCATFSANYSTWLLHVYQISGEEHELLLF